MVEEAEVIKGPSSPGNPQLEQYIRDREERADLAHQVEEVEAEAGRGVSRLGSMARPAERPQPKNLVNRRRLTSFRVIPKGTGDPNYFGVIEGKVFLDGAEQTEDAGATFDFYDNSFEVTAETYGWVDLDEVAGTWTMNTGASVPTPAARHQVQRLFKIAWDGANSKVDDENCEEYYVGDVYFFSGESAGKHAYQFAPTGDTGGTIETGECFLDGTKKTITNLPASLSGVTSSTKYWIEINVTTGAVDWKSGTGAYTAETSTLLVRPILEITCVDSKISSWWQRRCSDLHEYTIPGGVPDGAADGDILAWDETTDKAWEVNSMSGVADGDVLKWDSATKKWVKLTPTQITVVTDVQYDSTNHQLEKKTRTAYVLSPGSESGWTMITNGQFVVES